MKKLLSLILCIVLVCTVLVSCKKEILEDFLEKYRKNTTKDEAAETLNFYIVTGNGTGESAKTTVPQNINTYLKDKYNLELNINYFTEAEYQSKVLEAMNTTDESSRPDIVLINGVGMFDKLKGSLVPLNSEEFNFYGEDYKKLNSIVKQPILSASAENGIYYTVPNNHNVGNYEYIVFDQKIAQQIGYTIEYTFDGQGTPVASVNTLTAVEEFKSALAAKDPSLDADDYIQVVTGDYQLLETLKHKNLATEEVLPNVVNHVNILSYPNATREEAHLSAFAVIKQLSDDGKYESTDEVALLKNHYDKCMKIIYALNTDATFKNLLQYGAVGTNYTQKLDPVTKEPTDVVYLIDKGNSNRYEMNNIHTGDPFCSGLYYCEDNEFGWDKTTESNWLKQIAEAKMPTEKISAELTSVLSTLNVTSDAIAVNGGSTITVPTDITTYGDVVITWTATGEGIAINGNDITFDNADREVNITINLTCLDVTVTKVIKVTVNKTQA